MGDPQQLEQAIERLRSGKKLERDRALVALKAALDTVEGAELTELQTRFMSMLDESSWQAKHGGLLGCRLLLEHGRAIHSPGIEDFAATLLGRARPLLQDREARVRTCAGEVIGVVCAGPNGVELWHKHLRKHLFHAIRATLKRDEKYLVQEVLTLRKKLGGRTAFRDSSGDPLGDSSDGEITGSDSESVPVQRPLSADEVFHDTAGWRSLETNYQCLQRVVEACGSSFESELSDELFDLLYTGLKHKNRFVRETGFWTCGAIVDSIKDEAKLRQILGPLVLRLGTGLADNWSQVRMAASVATRNLLLRLDDGAREQVFDVLGPRMCLNRYHVAERVKLYSQETWELVMRDQGRHMIARHLGATVAFYIEQTDADNHAVREAACCCIAEIASKIDPEAVRPCVPQLLSTLLTTFKDDAWPVRSAACVASGRLVACFPDDCKSRMPELYELFFAHLGDSIWSVREDAAMALGNVVAAYGREAFEFVHAKLHENLTAVRNQQRESHHSAGRETVLPDNDPQSHTNQPMFSCNSLETRERAGSSKEALYRREPEPWELSDGYVYLVRELATQYPNEMLQLLPAVAELGTYRHYSHHVYLLATIWKVLPDIARRVGKRSFKQYVQAFFEPLVYTLQCGNALAADAAGECYGSLAQLLGPGIVRGRLELENPGFVHVVDASPYVRLSASPMHR